MKVFQATIQQEQGHLQSKQNNNQPQDLEHTKDIDHLRKIIKPSKLRKEFMIGSEN